MSATRLPPETIRRRLEIMRAGMEGREIEYCDINNIDKWYRKSENVNTWNWYSYIYRIKSEPVKQPLTLEDIPPGTAVRKIGFKRWQLVTGAALQDIDLQNSSINYLDLMENYEHSTDGGKTWKPCYK